MKDKLAFAFAAASTGASLYAVPSWRGFLGDPCLWAAAAAGLTIVILLITRHMGERARLFEVQLLALFLAGMPLIYLGRWILKGGHEAGYGWLFVEVVGLLVYAGLAILGLKRYWLIAVGIAAHGLAWDAWHYFGSVYIPSWYAVLCLVVDVGLAAYAASRIPAWRRAEERMADRRAALVA